MNTDSKNFSIKSENISAVEQPLVSVVTITWNPIKQGRTEYLKQCIESVKNQNYNNIEHIIIDGASTDGTLELLSDYPHLKIFSEPDNGIYDAMNKGMNKACGKYIIYLNSDDFWHDNNAVLDNVMVLENNNADYSYSNCTYLFKDKVFATLEHKIEKILCVMPFSHQTLFVKKEVMENLGGFDSQFKSAGDYDFIFRLIFSNAKGVAVDLNAVSYRLGGLSDFNQEQSIKELRQIYKKNYSNYVDLDEKSYEKIYSKQLFKKELIDKLIQHCENEDLKTKLLSMKQNAKIIGGDYCINIPENLERKVYIKVYKFLFLPIFKIKTKGFTKKYYIFGIPIFWITGKKKN